ncbi:hypothetical protein POM88_037670 [Heracleum sosnowskyi]|uniref:Uncharacterized protein n=1 Tax=Heracleum sosnowskyi TaxID=360622 RepID=A0AAD8HSL5_9APIA|nr:hypothetical protein POM88_037670 [Heracleum sosnowskyi]
MGACATKPKANATDAPAPLPEKDEVDKKDLTVAGTVIETKVVVVDVDKSRSLSNLFKQSEQVKGLTENDVTQTEMVKEEACEAEENTNLSETKTTGVVKSKILGETSAPTVINAVVEAEKAIEVEAATDKFEISVEKTAFSIADAPAVVKAEESLEVETANEVTETLEEKTSIPITYTPVEDEADKDIEVAPAIEIKETVVVEDKKIEEHDKAIETSVSESVVVESASSKIEVVEEKTSYPIVYVEANTKIEEAANEIQKAEVVEEGNVDKVAETQKPESPKKIAEESKKTTELEKLAIVADEKIEESKIEEEKAVTENQKALEEKTTDTEVRAETVKP